MAQFAREIDKCSRNVSAGGVLVMIDLDRFKEINDTFGHAAGDAALRLVARMLAGTIRAMDVAARLGGDEFALLLSGATQLKASGRVQRLAWQLNNLSLAWQGEIIPVRASVGMRGYTRGDTPESAMDAADEDMYAAKARRRDDETAGNA
jgi:diguanylate cyclase (GGDEF)-like protein